jgi:hypothetical protein
MINHTTYVLYETFLKTLSLESKFSLCIRITRVVLHNKMREPSFEVSSKVLQPYAVEADALI